MTFLPLSLCCPRCNCCCWVFISSSSSLLSSFSAPDISFVNSVISLSLLFSMGLMPLPFPAAPPPTGLPFSPLFTFPHHHYYPLPPSSASPPLSPSPRHQTFPANLLNHNSACFHYPTPPTWPCVRNRTSCSYGNRGGCFFNACAPSQNQTLNCRKRRSCGLLIKIRKK